MYQSISINDVQLWPPPAKWAEDTEINAKGTLAFNGLLPTGLWAVRFAFLLFFRRVGHNVPGLKVLWRLAFAFTFVAYLIITGIIPSTYLVAPTSKVVERCQRVWKAVFLKVVGTDSFYLSHSPRFRIDAPNRPSTSAV